jgi:hypothetical protein
LPENAVGVSRYHLIAISLIALAQSGCGTMHNLMAPPEGDRSQPREIGLADGPGICVPFGGVMRSAVLGFCGTPFGVSTVIASGIDLVGGGDPKQFEHMGAGMRLAGAGLIAIADTPLSLVGDLATWPLAYARETQQPWATWWKSEPGSCPIHRMFVGSSSKEEDKKPRKDETSQ